MKQFSYDKSVLTDPISGRLYFFLKKVVTLVDFENGSRPDADVVL